jgi:hypothetical protein
MARQQSYAGFMPSVELLYWDGCPSHPQALAELREALTELGGEEVDVTLTEIRDEQQARDRGFVGSPTVRVNGVDVQPPGPGEETGLACRVYRRRDGRHSPIPDPDDLREALRRLLPLQPSAG